MAEHGGLAAACPDDTPGDGSEPERLVGSGLCEHPQVAVRWAKPGPRGLAAGQAASGPTSGLCPGGPA